MNAREIGRLQEYKTFLDVASDYNRLMIEAGKLNEIFHYKEGVTYVFAHRTIQGLQPATSYMRGEILAIVGSPAPPEMAPEALRKLLRY